MTKKTTSTTGPAPEPITAKNGSENQDPERAWLLVPENGDGGGVSRTRT